MNELINITLNENHEPIVSASHTSILVGELAKLLKQNGVEIGATRLFTSLPGYETTVTLSSVMVVIGTCLHRKA